MRGRVQSFANQVTGAQLDGTTGKGLFAFAISGFASGYFLRRVDLSLGVTAGVKGYTVSIVRRDGSEIPIFADAAVAAGTAYVHISDIEIALTGEEWVKAVTVDALNPRVDVYVTEY